jgi:uncharacterized protein (TIGR03083 family)
MDKDAYLTTFHSNTDGLIAAARLGLEPPVPSCPGWTVADLVGHIGAVDWGWWHHVSNRAQERSGPPPKERFDSYPGLVDWLNQSWDGKADPTAAPSVLVDWYAEGARRLEETFRQTGPEEPIWHWSGDNRGIVHIRMQAIETAVHRWDAENAHTHGQPVQVDLARDGIDQHFEVMVPAGRRNGKPRTGSGESYHLHRTDGEGEWLVRFDGEDVHVSHEHAKAGVAVRGSASDLFLFLWGRVSASSLEVLGDASLLDRYRELVPNPG